MRPKLITPRNIILFLLAIATGIGLYVWQRGGSKIIGIGTVPSTAGKLAFVREENGTSDIYMLDGATGANAVALTSDNKGMDNEPAWSSDGETLALTSDRNGVVRQIYLMNAMPGAQVGVRTNTSTTKEMPQFGPDGDIFYLDGGRISKLSPQSADIDAVFPIAEQLRAVPQLQKLFDSGGVTRFTVSEDGSRILAAVKQERGEALVLWVPGEHTLVALGAAKKILFRVLPGDESLVVFVDGGAYPRPILVMNEDSEKEGAGGQVEANQAPGLPPLSDSDETTVVKIDPSLGITAYPTIPFEPTGFTTTPDGTTAALTSTDKKMAGVFTFDITNPVKGGQLSELPATEPSYSPDGSTLAFVSGDDIYTVPATGGEPKNLTQGKGRNLAPVWSPRKPNK